jgi:AcrR family transcriptional regulator
MLHEFQPRSPEETRTRILAATRELFAKKGRRGTTTREIAELAGVNEATLFRHFGNKDAIIEAVAEYYCPVGAVQDVAGALSGDLQTDLHKLATVLVDRMESVRDLIIASLVEEEADSNLSTAAWRGPSAIRQIVMDYMAKQVEAERLQGDPLLLARVFMGMIFALVIGRKKFPDLAHSTQEIIDFQINVFLNGTRKKN